jgi:hypothetical protein
VLREGDQIKSSSDIDRGWFDGGPAHVPAGRDGAIVEEHHPLLSESTYDVSFDGGLLSAPQKVEEVPERELDRHHPFFDYTPPEAHLPPRRRPTYSAPSGDGGGELIVVLVAIVAVIAAIYAVGVFIAGTLWAPVVGLERGWPDGSVSGYYFLATLGLIAVGFGAWVLAGLRRPSRSPNRRTARIALGSILVVGSLVALVVVLPAAVRSELRNNAQASAAESDGLSSATDATPASSDPSGTPEETDGDGGATTPAAAPTRRFDQWPAGKQAFTVQLASTSSLDDARTAVADASASGIDAGILYSSHYTEEVSSGGDSLPAGCGSPAGLTHLTKASGWSCRARSRAVCASARVAKKPLKTT